VQWRRELIATIAREANPRRAAIDAGRGAPGRGRGPAGRQRY
jgi:hypothetical protein